MYECLNCKTEVIVDHVNPPQFACDCEIKKCGVVVSGHAYGKGSMGEQKMNNNLSEASALIIRNTLFALAANEFIHNNKNEIYAENIRVKDSSTGKEFSFTLKGNRI